MVYHTLEEAADAAVRILEANWDGRSTVPAKGLYPHQWAWDSGLIAFGRASENQQRAQQEIRTLFEGQWDNGMLPHIIFDPDTKDYFPGPDFWNPGLSRHFDTRKHARMTSGCIQPPLETCAVLQNLRKAEDVEDARAFAKEIFPKLKAWHDYLYRERDPLGEHLVYIRHPWESGRDNSPVWDEVLYRMQFDRDAIPDYQRHDTNNWHSDGRPSDRDYDCYLYLCQIFKDCQYDELQIQERSPFLVQDLLFNQILCHAEMDLAVIAEEIGEDGEPFETRSKLIAESMRRKLWRDDLGVFLPYDLVDDKTLQHHEIGGFAPLYAGIPTREQADKMREHLDSRYFCPMNDDGCFGVSSYSRFDHDYDPGNYWRGPVWLNINWFIARGLERYGFDRHARWVRQALRDLPMLSGFREHYNPETGAPSGGVGFSWSAALFLQCYYDGQFESVEERPPEHAEECAG